MTHKHDASFIHWWVLDRMVQRRTKAPDPQDDRVNIGFKNSWKNGTTGQVLECEVSRDAGVETPA
jgi:hypothetical protein